MRRLVSLLSLLLVLFLTACSQAQGKCNNGLCVEVKSIGPIKKGESIPIQIKVKADKDGDIAISMQTSPRVIIEEVSDKAGLVSTDRRSKGLSSMSWVKSVKAKQEITIIQNIRFERTGNFDVSVVALLPDAVVTDTVLFSMTEKGGTELPPGFVPTPVNGAILDTQEPGALKITFSTSTPFPTPIVFFTITPLPTLTPTNTAAPYP